MEEVNRTFYIILEHEIRKKAEGKRMIKLLVSDMDGTLLGRRIINVRRTGTRRKVK